MGLTGRRREGWVELGRCGVEQTGGGCGCGSVIKLMSAAMLQPTLVKLYLNRYYANGHLTSLNIIIMMSENREAISTLPSENSPAEPC